MIQLEGLQEVTRHENGCWEPSCQLILSLRQFVMSSAIEEHRGAPHEHSRLVPCLPAKTKGTDAHQQILRMSGGRTHLIWFGCEMFLQTHVLRTRPQADGATLEDSRNLRSVAHLEKVGHWMGVFFLGSVRLPLLPEFCLVNKLFHYTLPP